MGLSEKNDDDYCTFDPNHGPFATFADKMRHYRKAHARRGDWTNVGATYESPEEDIERWLAWAREDDEV